MSKRWIILWVCLVGIVLPPLVVPFISPWSDINCRHEEINIRTGQARYSQQLWFLTISQYVEDTALSLALRGESVDADDPLISNGPAWHRVNTFSPGIGHSPHYRYHGTLAQTATLKLLFAEHIHSTAEQEDIARRILTAWQQSGDDDTADELLEQLRVESRAD